MTTLPYRFVAVLLEQNGDPVPDTEIPCSVWPATSAQIGPAGRHHSHSGEAALEYAAALRVPNRKLSLGAAAGELEGDYRIVGATPMEFVPHVVLELLLTSGRA